MFALLFTRGIIWGHLISEFCVLVLKTEFSSIKDYCCFQNMVRFKTLKPQPFIQVSQDPLGIPINSGHNWFFSEARALPNIRVYSAKSVGNLGLCNPSLPHCPDSLVTALWWPICPLPWMGSSWRAMLPLQLRLFIFPDSVELGGKVCVLLILQGCFQVIIPLHLNKNYPVLWGFMSSLWAASNVS